MNKSPSKKRKGISDYDRIISEVFLLHYTDKAKVTRICFSRNDLLDAATKIGLNIPPNDDEGVAAKNIGDVVYTYRFRKQFPETILTTAPKGKMWIILGAGDGLYEFRLITEPALSPDFGVYQTKVHDSTPEIVRRFTQLNDEQAILARIRYNRLIDLFGKCVSYSLQNHLRTKIKEIGQIEIDELYVGSNRKGEHFIIPVQAKRNKDKLGVSQLLQDLEYCQRVHPQMTAKPIAAYMKKAEFNGATYDLIALLEYECQKTETDIIIKKRAERHFLLLPWKEIQDEDFKLASGRPDED